MKRKLIIFLLIMSLLIVFVYISPKKINYSVKGIMYRLGNERYQENVKVFIEGDYFNNIFTGKKFKGKMYINDYELHNLVFKFDKYNSAELKSTSPFLSTYGTIYINENFTKFTICVFEQAATWSWNYETGLILSAPAFDRDEALEISKQLIPTLNLK